MKRTLLIGIGGIGVSSVGRVARYQNPFADDAYAETILLDADPSDLERAACGRAVLLQGLDAFTGVRIARDLLGPAIVKELLGTDDDECLLPLVGRKEAFVRMLLNAREIERALLAAIGALRARANEDDTYEICVAASLAGSTGSALFAAMTLWAKRLFARAGVDHVRATAFLVRPEVFVTRAASPRLAELFMANAHAALTELSIMTRTAHGEQTPPFRLGYRDSEPGILFDTEDKSFAAASASPFADVFFIKKQEGTENTVGFYTAKLTELLMHYMQGPAFSADYSSMANRLAPGYPLPFGAEVVSEGVRYPLAEVKPYILRKIAVGFMKKTNESECAEEESGALLDACLRFITDPLSAVVHRLSSVRRSFREAEPVPAPRLFASRYKREESVKEVYRCYEECLDTVKRYYRIFVAEIESKRAEIARALLNRMTDCYTGEPSLSLFFKSDGTRRTPAETQALLFAFRERVAEHIRLNGPVWKDLETFPEHPLIGASLLEHVAPHDSAGASAYLALGQERFRLLADMSETEATALLLKFHPRTDLDSKAIYNDASDLLEYIKSEAQKHLETLALQLLLNEIDTLTSQVGAINESLNIRLSAEEAFDADQIARRMSDDASCIAVGVEAEHLRALLEDTEKVWSNATSEETSAVFRAFGEAFCASLQTMRDEHSPEQMKLLAMQAYPRILARVEAALRENKGIAVFLEAEQRASVTMLCGRDTEPVAERLKRLLDALLARTCPASQTDFSVLLYTKEEQDFLYEQGLLRFEPYEPICQTLLDAKTEELLPGLAPEIGQAVRHESQLGEAMRLLRFRVLDGPLTCFKPYREAFERFVSNNVEKGTEYSNTGLSSQLAIYLS